jgi:4-aminobutyrate aminotransferase / (S)-3-amino-2-methylpropionate transaminase
MLSNVLKVRQLTPFETIEPLKPKIVSAIPGPESISLLNQYEGLSQDFKTVKFFADYNSSIGNYIADADGNLILDTSAQESSLAIGYNNPHLLSYIKSSNIKHNLMHRPSCSINPPHTWPTLIKSILMPLAPPGLTEVFNSCGCSYGSNENAIKAASIWYFKQKYGETYNEDQIKSALLGQEPGCPNFSLVSLKGGFHTNFSNLSSNKNPNFPKLNFLTADFPTLKYPGDNSAAESKSLESTWNLFKSNPNIFALILEPIQQKGNYYASKSYYKQLEKIVKEAGAALIVDETFVGLGGTGKLWAHEHWDINPDILVYGGKTQVTGFFMKPSFRPPQPYQLMNTYCGDPTRLEIFRGIRTIIQNENLVEKADKVGKYLLEKLYPIFAGKNVSNLRGLGLHIAFDLPNKDSAWKLCGLLLEKGVHVTVTNDNVIQLNPSLVFGYNHADVLLGAIEDSLS